MPVGLPPVGGPIGRSRMRISASGYVSWLRCPRSWVISNKIGLRSPVNPRMILGITIEDAVVGLLMESPIGKHIPNKSMWSAWIDDDFEGAEPVPEITSHDELKEWIFSKVGNAADKVIELGDLKWKETPSKTIDYNWEDIEREEIEGMIKGGLELFLEEVKACHELNGGSYLEEWRESGDPHKVPAPRWDDKPCFPMPSKVSGFSLSQEKVEQNILKGEGHVSWAESWEIARPWVKDPRVWQPQRLYHPEGWAAGEMDLVIRWRGETTIADIKASDGTSKYAEGLKHQLSFYRFLWDSTRTDEDSKKSNQVEALEGWYLKGPIRKKIEVMDSDELPSFSANLKEIWKEMMSVDFEISSWPDCSCGSCIPISSCEDSSKILIFGKEVLLPNRFVGNTNDQIIEKMRPRNPALPLSNIQSRVNLVGKIGGKWGPLSNHFGEQVHGAVLQTGGQSHAIIEEMSTGSFPNLRTTLDGEYLIRDAAPGLWRDKTRLYLDSRSKLLGQDDITDEIQITRLGLIQTKTNVDGLVVGRSRNNGQRLDGRPWSMVSAHLWDGKKIIELVAFGRGIISTLSDLQVGDRVLVNSAELGWRAGLPQLRINPRITRMEVISRDWEPEPEHPSKNL